MRLQACIHLAPVNGEEMHTLRARPLGDQHRSLCSAQELAGPIRGPAAPPSSRPEAFEEHRVPAGPGDEVPAELSSTSELHMTGEPGWREPSSRGRCRGTSQPGGAARARRLTRGREHWSSRPPRSARGVDARSSRASSTT